jgi:putative transposase
MSVRQQHGSDPTLWFVTFTCYNWLTLIDKTNAFDCIYKWFNYLNDKYQIKVTAFVIMPNHVHMILFFPTDKYNLNKLISNGKRFIAYEIIKRLKQQRENEILNQLAAGVSVKEKKKGQLHKVFKESFDAKAIETEKFFYQKLNYIHLNPVSGNNKLVDDWRDYEHSSASFYELNIAKTFEPVHYKDLE